ncbi:MAG: LTA synthase family protein [Rhodoferax sp.]
MPIAAVRTYFSCFLRAALRGVFRAWLLVLPLVLVLSTIRALQLFHFWPAGFSASAGDVAAALLMGLRFDLKVSAIAGFLLLLVLPWVSARVYLRLAAVLMAVLVLLSMVNLHYFGFYKTPIDAVVFGLVEDDTWAVLVTVWRDFPVLGSLLLVAALGWGAAALHRVLVRRARPDALLQARHGGLQLALVVLGVFALMLAGKGTLRAMALQRQHLTVTASQFLNDMVPNGAIALKYAWDSRGESQNFDDPLVGLKAYGFDSPRAAAEVLGWPSGSDAQVLAALRTPPALPAATPKKNLLFFLMESWSAEPLLYQGPQFDVLGRLGPAMAQACHFRNFDSAQPGTHPSLEAILFSSPITPLTMGELGRKPIPWSIARIAQEAGYHTVFATSARAGWRDLNRVLAVQGFDEVVDATQLQQQFPEAVLGIWGVWDHYLFRYLGQRLKQGGDKPLFVFVLSSTNHPPYDLPADYQRVPRDMARWKGETSSDTLVPNLDTFHYASDLLGGFVQEVMASPLGPKTVIGASGDHNVRSFGIYADPARRYLMRQVPFMVWGAGRDCGAQQDLPASHRDMFPTLFPLAGIQGPYIQTGRNLLGPASQDPLGAGRAVFFTGDARNAQGMWQLGKPQSFTCTSARPPQGACRFNAQDDLQERARLGLLDWQVRVSLRK